MEDLNAENVDHNLLCNLALEEAIKCASSGFENFDLFTRSVAYFLETIEINPGNYRAHLGLGLILLCVDSYEDSLNFLKNAYDMNPKAEIDAYIKLAEEGIKVIQSTKVEAVATKKKVAIDDLLNMTNKFKK